MYLSSGSAFGWFTTLSDDVKSNSLTTEFMQRFRVYQLAYSQDRNRGRSTSKAISIQSRA